MPTGYTSALYEGEQQTFQEFALSCARGFGAAILMRDDDPSVPITIKAITDDSDYHIKALERERKELARLKSLTPEQVADEARRVYLSRKEFEENCRENKLALRARYEAMLRQVEQWASPSSDHDEFKQFMVEQLKGSIDFDTSDKLFTEPVEQLPDAWLAESIERCENAIERYEEEERKRIERNEGRVRWVNQLRESLGLAVLVA